MKKIAVILVILFAVQWWFTDPTISVPTNDVTFSYIVKYTDASGDNDTLPMLIALHGNGDSPGNFYETALDDIQVPVRIVLLEGPVAKASGSSWPWTSGDFTQFGQPVKEAVERLSALYPTKNKPVLLGFSGGGMMAYYQAVKHGNIYSYIFPVSGKVSLDLLGDISSRPGADVFAYHGRSDTVISITGAREAVKILKSKNVNVQLTEFDGGHLGVFKNMKTEITNTVEDKILSLN